LRWIDGKNWCQYRFFNDGHIRGTLNRDTDYIYKKIKQSKTKNAHHLLNINKHLNKKESPSTNSNGPDFPSPLPKMIQNQD